MPSGAIVPGLAFSGHRFGQTAEDGKGHFSVFVVHNNGRLAFVDYDGEEEKILLGIRVIFERGDLIELWVRE
jgi:hypothetical protein